MAKRKDITGQRFHQLTAKRPTPKRERGKVLWECLCDCGKITTVTVNRLISGNTKSCGCLKSTKTIARNQAQVGSKNPCWRGGRRKSRRGYICIYSPDHPHAIEKEHTRGYMAEHRLVMEEKLGRYLKPAERVHHIDGNPSNNAPENLHLFPNNTTHFRWHRRLEEIALYD